MSIRRTSRRHQAGVVSSDYADFAVGQHVMTTDGFAGVVTDVLDGPYPGTEVYEVTLDAGMGGGQYTTSDLRELGGTTASGPQQAALVTEAVGDEPATAALDYPELAEILVQRPPLAHAEPLHMRASKTAAIHLVPEGTQATLCGADPSQKVREGGPEDACPDCMAKVKDGDWYSGVSDRQRTDWSRLAALYYLDTPESNALYEAASNVLGEASRAMATVEVPDASIEDGTAEALALAQRPDLITATHPSVIAAQTDWTALHAFFWCDNCGWEGELAPVADIHGAQVDICPQCGNVTPYEAVDAKGWPLVNNPLAPSPGHPGFPVAASRTERAADEHVFFATAGLWEKVLEKGTDVLNSQMKPEWQYKPGNNPSVDWCRFRHNERCMFPKHLNVAATKEAGYAVWIPEDRGRCPRIAWDEQKKCPVAEPGPESGDPNARVDATVPWESGGQRGGEPTSPANLKELLQTAGSLGTTAAFEFTASWSDVRAKAKRIRSEGGVRIISAPRPGDTIYTVSAEVNGDTHVYETTLLREPGKQNVASWACGCAWAAYSWGRSPAYARYEGRMCSHALALQYEAQAQGMFGRQIVEQVDTPPWHEDPYFYVKPEPGYTRAANLKTAARLRPVCLDGDLAESPLARAARLDKTGSLEGLKVLVHGTVKVIKSLVINDMHSMAAFTDGSTAPLYDVTYPTYDPVKGLTWRSKVAARTDDVFAFEAADAPPEAPTHAGLVLKAADTGRVLMLQRCIQDEDDPAAGTWEFPGGGREDADDTSLHAAMREFAEEVGVAVPAGGHVSHVWTSPNGVYVGHVVVIPSESDLDLSRGREEVNPDDPDGDYHEQSAWWDPDDAKKNPALREECKASPWGEIKKAASTVKVAMQSGYKEMWQPGERAWYEYHCTESADSCDAEIWYRSHQQVTVLKANLDDEESNGIAGATWDERAEEALPRSYQVRFDDGLEWTVMEDELSTTKSVWYRPDPPKKQTTARYLTLDDARAAAVGAIDPSLRLAVDGVPVREWATAERHDEPEPALPSTDGAEDEMAFEASLAAIAMTIGVTPDADVEQAADELLNWAHQHDALITGAVRDVCDATDGEMDTAFLPNRIKGRPRMIEKIRQDVQEKHLTPAQIAMRFSDALRFTVLYSTQDYADHTAEFLRLMAVRGFRPDTPERVKNFWLRDDPYDGVNSVLRGPDGFPFEVQFHTSQSMGLKNNIHGDYEEFRGSKGPTTPERRKTLWDSMISKSHTVERPTREYEIGVPTQHHYASGGEVYFYYAFIGDLPGEYNGVFRRVESPTDVRFERYSVSQHAWIVDNSLARHLVKGSIDVDPIDSLTAQIIVNRSGGSSLAVLHTEALVADALADPDTAPQMAEEVTATLVAEPPGPGDPRLAWLMGSGGAPEAAGGTPQTASDGDIAAQAKAFLAKQALKAFTPAEQAEIINEGIDVQAANLGDLDIAGTHYEGLEAAFAAAEDEDDL